MAQYPKILKNFTAYVDGIGYAGRIEEVELPKLAVKTEEYQGGGMAAPVEIDMGTMDKLEATLTFAEYDPDLYKQWGLIGKEIGMTLRGAIQQPGPAAATPYVVELRGKFRELDSGSWKAGEKAQLKATIAARYYKLSIDGTAVIEIDPVNMKRVVGDTDQLADQRQALGL